MKVVNYVQIDFSKNKDITVPSMQYDSGSRWVRLKLFNNGIPVNLNGIRVCIMVAKPDGKEVFNDCVIVDAENGLVEFEITNQMVVVAGEVECQIKLMEQDKLLSSEIFTLFVNKGLTPTNIDSENELNVLVDALNRVEHLDQELSGEIMASFEASQTQRDETFKEKLLEYDERFLEIKGEKGDKGDKGDTGERGLQGPVGPQGSKGDVGEQGPVGPQGPKGDKGDQGEVGAIGPIGLQGPIGLTGPQGETGPQGPKGEKGLDGRSVELGVYGGQVKWRYAGQEENVGWTPLISLDSLRGSQGPQGEKGETGPQGPKGEKGDSGGVMPADMVDYMGNQHETLKAKNDADVDWLLGEINTAHYEGQQITATDSIEGRAKSAILSGQTLKNINDYRINLSSNVAIDEDGMITLTANGKYTEVFLPALEKLPSTKYWVGINVIENTLNGDFNICAPTGNNCIFNYFFSITQGFVGIKEQTLTTMSDLSSAIYTFRSYLSSSVTEGFIKYKVMVIPYQDGMENWTIPYFTGIKSVRMPVLTTTGKNLMDINSRDVNSVDYHGVTYSIDSNGYYSIKGTLTSNGRWVNTFDLTKSDRWGNSNILTDDFMLKKGTYTLSAYDISGETSTPFKFIRLYKKPFTSIAQLYNQTSTTFTLNEDTKLSMMFQTVNYNSGDSIDVKFKVQIEDGTQATSYEPHKSNILTVNEEVELRGIGDVRDTLDLVTGEMTKCIGEIVLDGSEVWSDYSTPIGGEDYISFTTTTPKLSNRKIGFTNSLCDGMKIGTSTATIDEFIEPHPSRTSMNNWVMIRILKSRLETSDNIGFKKWLSNNPLTLQYELIEKSIKTVDLSDYHVYSFKDTTHYSCGSEDGSLIPSLSIDVPTNLPALVSRQRATIESQKEQIQTLEVENEILTNEIQRVDEKGEQADLEQLSMTWEIDYRVSEVEWFLEDNLSSTLLVAEKINLKLGGNTMALSRFEQAKILILAGAYNRETLEKQLTNYLKRGYLTTEEYDELIALMDAKELVSEN